LAFVLAAVVVLHVLLLFVLLVLLLLLRVLHAFILHALLLLGQVHSFVGQQHERVGLDHVCVGFIHRLLGVLDALHVLQLEDQRVVFVLIPVLQDFFDFDGEFKFFVQQDNIVAADGGNEVLAVQQDLHELGRHFGHVGRTGVVVHDAVDGKARGAVEDQLVDLQGLPSECEREQQVLTAHQNVEAHLVLASLVGLLLVVRVLLQHLLVVQHLLLNFIAVFLLSTKFALIQNGFVVFSQFLPFSSEFDCTEVEFVSDQFGDLGFIRDF